MATGRTALKYARAYIDGYDVSGYARSIGPLVWDFETLDATCPMGDAVKGYFPGRPNITPTVLNGVFDNTALVGLHTVFKTPGVARHCMFPWGIRAAPAQGDPVFVGRFQHSAYTAESDGIITANLVFDSWDASTNFTYAIPWGDLLHANSAAIAVNASAGIDNPTAGATAFGGYMMYQVFACAGGAKTGVIKVQDAAVNNDGGFADIAPVSLTTGVLDFTLPQAGIIAIPTTATIRQFTRWQIVLTTMTSITFALAFVRNYHA